MDNTVILISAKMRAGKTTLANGLVNHYGGVTFNMGDYVRVEAKRLGVATTRTNLQNLGQKLMTDNMVHFCEQCLGMVKVGEHQLLVIAGIRKEAQIAAFKKLLPKKRVIHLHLDLNTTEQLMRMRKENEDVQTLAHETEVEIDQLGRLSELQVNGTLSVEDMINQAIKQIDAYVVGESV